MQSYRVEYSTSSPDNEVWIPPGPPPQEEPHQQELHENFSHSNMWITPGSSQIQDYVENSMPISRQVSQYSSPYEFVPPISKFEPPPSYTENDENKRF